MNSSEKKDETRRQHLWKTDLHRRRCRELFSDASSRELFEGEKLKLENSFLEVLGNFAWESFFREFFVEGKFFRLFERMKIEKTIHMVSVKVATERRIHANPSNKTWKHGLCDGTSVFVTS